MNMTNETGKSGIILFAVLATITALALLAGTIATIATTDIRMAAAFKRAADAFYNTEAAIHYVKSRIESDLASGTILLGGATVAVNYTATTGMTFETVHQLTRSADTNAYFYRVTGREHQARCTIEVLFRRGSIFELGLFGDESFDTKAYGSIFMYDSSETSSPTPSDSIGGAVVACNGNFLTHQGSYIDGSFQLGSDSDGATGSWSEMPTGGSIVTGEPALPTDRIDPDPLGAVGGSLESEFTYFAIDGNNSNAGAIPPIRSPKHDVTIGNGETNTLVSGVYYIDDLIIRNGGTLEIHATNGPVKIYLTGAMEAKEGSTINCGNYAADLFLFSNSDASIIIKNDGSFSGLIYAPFADIQIRNSGDFYGTAWGSSLDIKNSGEIYVDAALMAAFPNNTIRIISWKEIRPL